MTTLKFKTTINCGGCVAKVTPVLSNETRIEKWEVDTSHPDKILTVQASDISAEEVMEKVKATGFKMEQIESASL